MGIKSLIQFATVLAFLAVSSGKLPTILQSVRVAQLQLQKDAQATKWGQTLLPPGN